MKIRNIRENDVGAIRAFVEQCPPLGVHTNFSFWVIAKFFSNHSFILEQNGAIIGYVSAVRSTVYPDVLYLWQIGVSKEHRGKKLSQQLIDAVVKSVDKDANIQFSIDPENKASFHCFRSYAESNEIEMTAVDELSLIDPLTKKSEHEIIYEYLLKQI